MFNKPMLMVEKDEFIMLYTDKWQTAVLSCYSLFGIGKILYTSGKVYVSALLATFSAFP